MNKRPETISNITGGNNIVICPQLPQNRAVFCAIPEYQLNIIGLLPVNNAAGEVTQLKQRG